jgi:DNA sulfur modification protein DndC
MRRHLHEETIEAIKAEYCRANGAWMVAFSGGKDSSALVTLVFQALNEIRNPRIPVNIVFCDTGVEIPPARSFAYTTLRGLAQEARQRGLPIGTRIVHPRLDERFFVVLIGKGYPPPTNKFRWCTDRLRVGPMHREAGRLGRTTATILLGTRGRESNQRNRAMHRHRLQGEYYYRQVGWPGARIFAPLVNFAVADVWQVLRSKRIPESINTDVLVSLYRSASGLGHQGSVCGPPAAARFGCWICTVVRKDHAMCNLVHDGYPDLAPLLEFRDWLGRMRECVSYRWRTRRNHRCGPGPLTLRARREVLKRLLDCQDRTGLKLITDGEVMRIQELWKEDRAAR